MPSSIVAPVDAGKKNNGVGDDSYEIFSFIKILFIEKTKWKAIDNIVYTDIK